MHEWIAVGPLHEQRWIELRAVRLDVDQERSQPDAGDEIAPGDVRGDRAHSVRELVVGLPVAPRALPAVVDLDERHAVGG